MAQAQMYISPFRLWHHRALVGQLTRRMIAQRYRGSVMGVLWSLLTPLLMLTVYGLVFGVVFEARWQRSTGPQGEFAVMLFAGLILHQLFAEVITRTPTIIAEHASFVRKVVFPLEILPPVIVMSSLFQWGISCLVMLGGVVVVYGGVPLTVLWLPVVVLPLVILAVGLGWLLAALGVFVRDISQIMGVLTTLLLFFSTIFYPADALPDMVQSFVYYNPLSFIVDQVRQVVILGDGPDVFGMLFYMAVSVVVYLVGGWWFLRTRHAFADVV